MLVALCQTGERGVRQERGNQSGAPAVGEHWIRWKAVEKAGKRGKSSWRPYGSGSWRAGQWQYWWRSNQGTFGGGLGRQSPSATRRGTVDVSRSPVSDHQGLVPMFLRLAPHQPWCQTSEGHQGTIRWLLLLKEGGIYPGKCVLGKTLAFRDRQTAASGERLLRCQPASHTGNTCLCCFAGLGSCQMFGENTSTLHMGKLGWEAWVKTGFV